VQTEDGIRVFHVTGVQTCALPIFDGTAEVLDRVLEPPPGPRHHDAQRLAARPDTQVERHTLGASPDRGVLGLLRDGDLEVLSAEIGRAAWRERKSVAYDWYDIVDE